MVSTSSVQREEEKIHVVVKKKDAVWRNEKDKKKNGIAKYRSE